MADKAKAAQRVEAIGNHLATFEGVPTITKVAGKSAGPRTEGKVVIITGCNSTLGIGRATALQFAENGARAIYICDFADSNLASHKSEIQAQFPSVDVHARQFDAADEASVRDIVDEALKSYGRLDVYFANAGIIGMPNFFTEIPKDDFMKVMNTNVASVFLAAKYAAPAMRKTGSNNKQNSGGSIIGTASVAGLRSNAGPVPYSAAKAAVVNLAQSCAYQLAGTGVRVNAICPGLIETGMTSPTFEAARAKGTEKKVGQLNPLKRAAHADEVARVALFLGSDEASYVNGQAWAVDGGLSAGLPYVQGKMM